MKPAPTVIVLAAGLASRYQGARHKLDEPLAGSTVLGCTLQAALASRLPVLLVTTAGRLPSAQGLLARRDIVVVSDAEARRGMGRSIATGVAERASAPGWLILPGDLPLVRAETLRAVAAGLDQHAVVYAQHKGRRGHPVGFGAELYSELVGLDGDEGARRVVARYPVHGLEVDDPGVLLDVDTAEDLARLRALVASAPAPGKAGVSTH